MFQCFTLPAPTIENYGNTTAVHVCQHPHTYIHANVCIADYIFPTPSFISKFSPNGPRTYVRMYIYCAI
jgi:hypothetical protein